jgi:aryl-alcohol dehydrogenase
MTQVTAAVLDETGGVFRLASLDLDEPREDEVLVRIVAAGICHTDAGVQALVPKPAVLGHEGAGVVERVGARVARVRPGDHVVLTFGSCGACPGCEAGTPHLCEHGHALQFACQRGDGSTTLLTPEHPVHGAFFQQSSFATHALVTERNTVVVTRDVPLELLGPLGCGFQTGAGAVMNSLELRAGASLAVFGVGAVGLSAVMAGAVVGATLIIAVDVNVARLELGATHALNADEGDVADRIRLITGRGVDAALETSGVKQSFNDAIDCLAMGGACGLVTIPHIGTTFPFTPRGLLGKAATLRGVIEGSSVPETFIPRLIELYRQGRFPIDRLVTYYPFTEINAAFRDAAAGTAVKPILRMA